MIEVFRIEHKDNHGVIDVLTPITEASRREDNEISLRDFKIDETNSTLLETILLGKDCLWSSECMEKLKKHLQFEETIV